LILAITADKMKLIYSNYGRIYLSRPLDTPNLPVGSLVRHFADRFCCSK